MDISVDTSEFRKAIKSYIATTKKALPEIVHQRSANIFRWAIEFAKTKEVSVLRRELRAKFSQKKIVVVKTKKGTISKKPKVSMLMVQWLNKNSKAVKGLYGVDMKNAVDGFMQRIDNSAGFLGSLFVPIIRRLNPLIKFKVPFKLTRPHRRWRSSRSAIKNPNLITANASNGNTASMYFAVDLKRPEKIEVVRLRTTQALQKAIDKETKEIRSHVANKRLKDIAKMFWKNVK